MISPDPVSAAPPSPLSPFRLGVILFVTWLGLLFDGLEMGLYTAMIGPALKSILATSDPSAVAEHASYALSAFMIGAALGGALFGRIGDRIGRSKTMVLTILVYAVFTGLTGLVRSFPQLLACRFLGALGLGGEWGVGVALLAETWPEKRRPLLAGIAGAGINVGFLCAAVVGKWVNDPDLRWDQMLPAGFVNLFPAATAEELRWRLLFTAGLFPALLTLGIRIWVPEPDRWVRSRDKARAVSLGEVMAPAYRRRTLVAILLSAVALLGTWGSFLWLSIWVDKVASSPADKFDVVLWQSLGMIAGSFLGGPLADWMGRRWSYAFLCVTAWASVVALAFLGLKGGYGFPVKLWACVAGVFVTAFFGWAPLYLPELFPTHLRAYGQGLCFNIGRILTAAGVLLTGKLVKLFAGDYAKAMIVMASVYAIGLVAIWFAPETKGKALPE